MPYELTRQTETRAQLRAWPHNALPPRGYATTIALTASTLALPLLAVIGSPVLWGLLPFALLAIWGLWYALDRNWRDRQILERMDLNRSRITLHRFNPRGPDQDWTADPNWARS